MLKKFNLFFCLLATTCFLSATSYSYDVIKDIFGENITFDSYGTDLNNKIKMKELIISTANDPNTLTFFSTKYIEGGDRKWLAPEYDLVGNHAYSIKGFNEETGIVYITNPWHTSIITEVPLYATFKLSVYPLSPHLVAQ